MERTLWLATAMALPLFFFLVHIILQVRRGIIYRDDNLIRAESNQMHRQTLWTVPLCASMIVVAAIVPSTRLLFGLTASIMLIGVLPLMTLFIEIGVRYSRRGKPRSTELEHHGENGRQ